MPGNTTRHAQHGSVGFDLWAIALALAALSMGGAYLLDSMSRASRTAPHMLDPQTVMTRSLGGRDLQIPRGWFRYDEQAVEGFAKQIELRLELPLGFDGAQERVEVTLLPRSRVRPSAALLDGVYLHRFEAEQLSGPPGLVGKPLKPTDGYDSEVVWYDPLSADPFVAKCSRLTEAAQDAQCVRTVYLAPGIGAIYAFSEKVLPNWRSFDPLLKERMSRIKAL